MNDLKKTDVYKLLPLIFDYFMISLLMLNCQLYVYDTFLIMTFKLISVLLFLTLTSYSPSSVSVPDTCS